MLNSYDEGKRLFEIGMERASQYKTEEAIKYYTKSINANKNPAPYINRANLLSKRIRHYEALQDILEAKRLDEEQGNDFALQISQELIRLEPLTSFYRDGTANKFVRDFESKGVSYVTEKIVEVCFGVKAIKHFLGSNKLIEYHFFNELDNFKKFENLSFYPGIEDSVSAYPEEFIDYKIASLSDSEWQDYRQKELLLHMFLCAYPENIMLNIRGSIIYEIDCYLMRRDFGDFWMTFSSECEGITLEAKEFIEKRNFPRGEA